MVIAAIASFTVWSLTRPGPPDLIRLSIVPPDAAPLTFGAFHRDLAISADGTQVVYAGRTLGTETQLNVRPIDQLDGAPLRGGEGGTGPFVSPNGQWIGFVDITSATILQKVSIFGGPPVRLTEAGTFINGASWGGDDQIIFGTTNGGLFRVSGTGGDPEPLTTLDAEQGETSHTWPFIIPGREAVVFVISTGTALTTGQLAVLDLDTRGT